MKNLLCLALLTGVGLTTLQANPFTWTGGGGNGDWTNAGNWSTPGPDFSAATGTLNQYQFIFNSAVETTQNMGGVARRFSRLTFSNADFTLSNGGGSIIFGQSTGGFVVHSGDQVITAGQFAINVFTNTATGGFDVKGGSLTLNASSGFSIAGSSSLRYLPIDGNGTLTLNGILTTNSNGGTVRLRETFGGRLILNTGGSTIHTGDLQHLGTGTLELRADDALGGLHLRLENASAKLESGGGSRVLQNAVSIQSGLTLTGSHSMEFADHVEFGPGNVGVSVAEADGLLVLSGTIEGSGSELVKSGAGTLRLAGEETSSWSHSLRIASGRLEVGSETGSATGQGSVVIEEGAHLAGFGRIQGAVSVRGNLSLEGVESLVFGSALTLEEGSRITLEHGAAPALLEGDLHFGSEVTLVLGASELWQVGETYRLFDLANGNITGSLALEGPMLGEFHYQSGENGFVDFTVTAIPEPGDLTLLGIAFGMGVLALRSRKRSAAASAAREGSESSPETARQEAGKAGEGGGKGIAGRISRTVMGFSLVEVLIAAAIIAVVALVGAGVMSKTRSKAASVSCLSNLRAHVNAARLFSMENKGIFPSDNVRAELYPYLLTASPVNGTRTIRHWQGPLHPSGSPSQTVCRELMAVKENTRQYPSYAMNQYLTSSYGGGVVHSWQKHRQPLAVPEPSLIYFFMDAPEVGIDSSGETYFRSMARVGNDFLFPHGDGLNIAFVDGRVEWRARAVFNDAQNMDTTHPRNPWIPQ